MIQLTRLNHVPLIVNADLIEHVEVTPDTVIALTTGQKFLVLESAEEVVRTSDPVPAGDRERAGLSVEKGRPRRAEMCPSSGASSD